MYTALTLLLVPLVLTMPQNPFDLLSGSSGQGSIMDTISNILNNPAIKNKILNSDMNPCKGKAPASCSCTNGASFDPDSVITLAINSPLSTGAADPCGGKARPSTCTCPQGNTFEIDDMTYSIATKWGIPNCGKGVLPSNCQCKDGSTFNTDSINQVPCGGNPFNIQFCSCPNGKVINKNQFIAAMFPLMQEILG